MTNKVPAASEYAEVVLVGPMWYHSVRTASLQRKRVSIRGSGDSVHVSGNMVSGSIPIVRCELHAAAGKVRRRIGVAVDFHIEGERWIRRSRGGPV